LENYLTPAEKFKKEKNSCLKRSTSRAFRIIAIPTVVLLVAYFIMTKFSKYLRLYDEKYPFAGQCTEINDLFINN